jgi:FAD/FMN-containing dehydrogenase
VLRYEVVNAEGEIVIADAHQNPELFWALRGSCSSSFGIISTVTLKLHKLDSHNFTLISLPIINFTDSNAVTQAGLWWQQWASIEVTEKCTSTLTFDKSGLLILATWYIYYICSIYYYDIMHK